MSRRNKENAMRNMMEETFDRISDGSLDVGGDSDGGYNGLPKDNMVNGIPAMNDNDFLDKLQKRYKQNSDDSIGSQDEDSDDSQKGRGNKK
jgi:hypothetical protein